MTIFYKCDGKACENPSGACGRECTLTTDIEHAVNFRKENVRLGVGYAETNRESSWREVTDGSEILWYRCLNCRKTQPFKTDFCPYCGADMRGNNNDKTN